MKWADYFRSRRTGKELCTNLRKYLTEISPLLPHVKNGSYFIIFILILLVTQYAFHDDKWQL